MSNGNAAAPVRPTEPSAGERLDSWKEIAAYLKRDVRTVQRWEKKAGLPVHRLVLDKQGSVYAYKSELDTWWTDRRPRLEQEPLEEGEEQFPEAAEPEQELQREVVVETAAPRPPAQKMSPWAWLVLAAIVVVGVYIVQQLVVPKTQPLADKIMLAVLPFDNLTGDPQQEFFSDGLTEEMIAQLGRMHPERLGVIARTSVMQYKGSHKSAEEIGQELRVNYILEGSVRRDANRARITAQLIQVSDQTHKWVETYDRDLRDILALQSDVARAIAEQIQIALTPQQQERLTRTRVVNPEAYEAYLWGRFFWNKRNEEGLRRSIGYFNRAIAADPNYALAYSGLADAYDVLGFFGVLPPTEAYPRAKAAAQKALQLDESLAEAHASLADVSYLYDWDWQGAEKEFKRAIALNPSYATAHQWYGTYLALLGRSQDSEVEMGLAQGLDPLSMVISSDAASNLYYIRQDDRAVEQLKKLIERDPNFSIAHMWLGLVYRRKGMTEEAIAEFKRALQLEPRSLLAVGLLGNTYGATGRRAEANAALSKLRTIARQRYVPSVYFAMIYGGLNDKDQALHWLNQAFQEHSPLLVRLKSDPMADPVRSDPRFQDLLRRIGLGR